MYIFLFTLILTFLYVRLILKLLVPWISPVQNKSTSAGDRGDGVSVLLVVRNEAENIDACVRSIIASSNSLQDFEILIVDDHSDDNTIALVSRINDDRIKIIRLSDYQFDDDTISFKKEGIKIGITRARFDIIAQTDGDCIVQGNWLEQISHEFSSKELRFLTGPVCFSPLDSFLTWFQQLDMLSLIATTRYGIENNSWFLANGANMAYRKSSLPENVYSESKQYASGDDVFLVNSFAAQNHTGIEYRPDIMVYTFPVKTLGAFFSQRIRWAAKNKILMKGPMGKILILPVLFNGCLLLLPLALIVHLKWTFLSIIMALFFKFIVDLVLLQEVNKSFHPQRKLSYYYISFLVFPFYFIFTGVFSFVTKGQQWKGRNVA